MQEIVRNDLSGKQEETLVELVKEDGNCHFEHGNIVPEDKPDKYVGFIGAGIARLDHTEEKSLECYHHKLRDIFNSV